MKKDLVAFFSILPISFGFTATIGLSQTLDRSIINGRDWALIVCAACHIVAPDHETPDTLPKLSNPGPSFQDIANDPNVTAASLHNFLSTAHGNLNSIPRKMPDPRLSENQKAEVIAYIMSLRRIP